jgi:hypothetical protein
MTRPMDFLWLGDDFGMTLNSFVKNTNKTFKRK